MRRLSQGALGAVFLAAIASPSPADQSTAADGTDPQSFFVLNNPGDPAFNQLLGINDGHVIVGYFGDGTVIPNNGSQKSLLSRKLH